MPTGTKRWAQYAALGASLSHGSLSLSLHYFNTGLAQHGWEVSVNALCCVCQTSIFNLIPTFLHGEKKNEMHVLGEGRGWGYTESHTLLNIDTRDI